MTTQPTGAVAVIGAGNMASAIVRGCLACHEPPVTASDWIVVAISDQHAQQWSDTGVRLRPSVAALEDVWADVSTVLLAVKPQVLPEVAKEAKALSFDERLVISILAGTTIGTVTESFTNLNRVVRAMPNTPLRVGKGLTALCPSEHATKDDLALARALFGSAGETVDLPEELFDAFTAMAGSGPAYLFYLAQAMTEAGEKMGFEKGQARAITAQTLLGASTLLHESGEDPAHLRTAVTSKGGTTHAAISKMDKAGVLDAIHAAVIAARDRGRELAKG